VKRGWDFIPFEVLSRSCPGACRSFPARYRGSVLNQFQNRLLHYHRVTDRTMFFKRNVGMMPMVMRVLRQLRIKGEWASRGPIRGSRATYGPHGGCGESGLLPLSLGRPRCNREITSSLVPGTRPGRPERRDSLRGASQLSLLSPPPWQRLPGYPARYTHGGAPDPPRRGTANGSSRRSAPLSSQLLELGLHLLMPIEHRVR